MMRQRTFWVVTLLLVLGAAVRVFAAWCLSLSRSPDFGIVCLMAKHMSEGTGFPLFFYGQPFMGSLEPALSALFCRLFGISGFTVNLGTAFLGILLLPVVYMWGRDAAGKTGGIAALAYCVVGPTQPFLEYQSLGRGGYAVALLAGTAVMWITVRIISRERKREKPRVSWYVALGILAGLGWWSNQLITASLITAAVLFLVAMGRRMLSWRTLAGLAGFVIGTLPLWVWNIQNRWGTFTWFSRHMGEVRFAHGLRQFFMRRLPGLFHLPDVPPAWQVFINCLHLALAVIALLVLIRRLRKHGLRDQSLHLLAVFLFILVSSLMFGQSTYADTRTRRYVLPLVPAIAVLLGTATEFLKSRLPRMTHWVPLLLVAGSQLSLLPSLAERHRDNRSYAEKVQALAAFLRDEEISSIYIPYNIHGLNFMLREEFCFSDLHKEKYRPYLDRLELAQEIAVMHYHGDVQHFLKAGGGSARRARVPKFSTHHDFVAPASGLREIPPEEWSSATDARANSILPAITDTDTATCWQNDPDAGAPEFIELSFDKPKHVCALRLLARNSDYPETCEIEVDRDGEWRTITEEPLRVTGYYWSGPRPYWSRRYFRFHCRFSPHRTSRMRIRLTALADKRRIQISEVQVFEAGPDQALEQQTLPALVKLLDSRGIKDLYSDRWVANTVFSSCEERIRTARSAGPQGDQEPLPSEIELNRDTAFLVRSEDAPLCRRALKTCRISMRETAIDPFVLFDFGTDLWMEAYAECRSLRWAGFSCLTAGGARKQRAFYLSVLAEESYRKGSHGEAINMLSEAVATYPNFRPAYQQLAQWCRTAGNDGVADDWEDRSRKMWSPSVPASVRFSNGVEFEGISIEPRELRPGSTLNARYYWRVPELTGPVAVFVHIRNSENRNALQDDHVLLEDADTSFQPFSEVFVEHRTIAVPADMTAGTYKIYVGLHKVTPPGRRLDTTTEFNTERNAVLLPLTLDVETDPPERPGPLTR